MFYVQIAKYLGSCRNDSKDRRLEMPRVLKVIPKFSKECNVIRFCIQVLSLGRNHFKEEFRSHVIFSKRCQLSSLKILLKVQNHWSALGSAAIKSIASYSILGSLWYQMNQKTCIFVYVQHVMGCTRAGQDI